MKRLKDLTGPIVASVAVVIILLTAIAAAITPVPIIHAASTQDAGWTAGYDQGHIEGACVALTGTVGCDWTTVNVCPVGTPVPPCVVWIGDHVTLHLAHTCPWLPSDEAACVDDRDS